MLLGLQENDREKAVSFFAETLILAWESLAQSVVWCLYEMAKKPHILAKVQAELDCRCGCMSEEEVLTKDDLKDLKYLRWVWKETLQHHTANVGIVRMATADLVLKGSRTKVRKGSTMMAFVYGMHMDENLWSRASEFWPERWEKDSGAGKFLPYGKGEWNCLGMFLAEFEGPLILAEMLRRFQVELACGIDEVVNCSLMSELPRTRSKPGGKLDRGVPVRVRRRSGNFAQ